MSYVIVPDQIEGEPGKHRLRWKLSTKYDLDDSINIRVSFIVRQQFANEAEGLSRLGGVPN